MKSAIFQSCLLLLPLVGSLSSSPGSGFVQACTPPANASSEILTVGTDPPADLATVGYTLNHLALVVSNITATRQFYGTVLGMRHVFTFHASQDYDITYLGYSHGGKNGTGYQTGESLYLEKANIEGLIEFLHLSNAEGNLTNAADKPGSTFSHIGMIVPDIQAIQARMDQYNVPVLKRLGVGGTASSDPSTEAIANAYGLGDGSVAAMATALAGIQLIGFENFSLVQDPDGNVVEIQQQS